MCGSLLLLHSGCCCSSSHARQSHESNFSVYTKAPFRSMCCDSDSVCNCDLPPSVARIVGGCSSSNGNGGNIWLQNSFTATSQAEAASIVACRLYKASWKGQKPVQTPEQSRVSSSLSRSSSSSFSISLPFEPSTCAASANNANCANVQAKFWRQILLFFDQ